MAMRDKRSKKKVERRYSLAEKTKLSTISQISIIVASIATIVLAIYAFFNYSKFIDSLELSAKNIELTHKPIVFIKYSITHLSTLKKHL